MIMDNERVHELLIELLESKKYRELKKELCDMNEVDIATFMEELDNEKSLIVFRMLPKELATEVFACLEVEQQESIIDSINDTELKYIIEDLYVDDAVDMLEELPARVVKKVPHRIPESLSTNSSNILRIP